jgi:predicted dehydrogenase
MTRTYVRSRPKQSGGLDKLGIGEKNAAAPRGDVDVDDEVMTLVRFTEGAVGSIEATRNAHGRHNFLTFEIHGTKGSIAFNYERRDELRVAFADDPGDASGFRTVYTGPAHPYGESFWPIPGLGIGYTETKIAECHDFLAAVTQGVQPSPNFEDGYRIARIVDALLESASRQAWIQVPS